ncbi:MAG TPA: hypothetical protein VFV33_16780, partial [Gemmatimonadaceae bacterium]|nr:hypothetical protein [Gemmatimonadaceae bacterium]
MPIVSRRALLALLALGACTRPQPAQVLAPVRIDIPQAVTRAEPSRTTADDPLARIDRMEWPGPNAYRGADGSPGPQYWQQRADYTISATLDTAAQSVSGAVTIRYTNNAPD